MRARLNQLVTMTDATQLQALQTNTEWARTSARHPGIGRAIASIQRNGSSSTPYALSMIFIGGRNHILCSHGAIIAAIPLPPPLTLITLPLAQYPPDAQLISLCAASIARTPDASPSPILAVAFLTSSLGTSTIPNTTTSPSSADKDAAAPPRCWLHFYGGHASAETLTALTEDVQVLALDWIPAQITTITYEPELFSFH